MSYQLETEHLEYDDRTGLVSLRDPEYGEPIPCGALYEEDCVPGEYVHELYAMQIEYEADREYATDCDFAASYSDLDPGNWR